MTEPAKSGGAPAASDQYVQSLARGLAVIRAFDTDHPKMTLTEVAARTDLTRATARRFLHTLVELGYVRTDGKIFALTAKVLQLGYAYLSGLSLPQLAQPHLEELSARTGGVDVGRGARGHRHRLHRPGVHPADHDRRHHGGHPVPRLRHLDGPGAARGPAAGEAGGLPRGRRDPAPDPRSHRNAGGTPGGTGHRPRPGLVPAGPGAGAGADVRRGAGPRRAQRWWRRSTCRCRPRRWPRSPTPRPTWRPCARRRWPRRNSSPRT